MAITDLVIGNTRIFIFTWSGFLLPILVIPHLNKLLRSLSLSQIICTTGLGIISNLFFFLWTNFGVWILDSWSMYPRNLAGLLHCYYMGLPFLRLQLSSTLVFVPLVFITLNIIKHWILKFKPRWVYNT
jgi:hypothetical protein